MAKEEKTPDAASDSSVKPSTWVESVSKMMAEVVEKDAERSELHVTFEMVGDFRKRYLGHTSSPSFVLEKITNGGSLWEVRAVDGRPKVSSFNRAHMTARRAKALYDRATWANAGLVLNPIFATMAEVIAGSGRPLHVAGVPIQEIALVETPPTQTAVGLRGLDAPLTPLELVGASTSVAVRHEDRWALLDAGAEKDPTLPLVFKEDPGRKVAANVVLNEAAMKLDEAFLASVMAGLKEALADPAKRRARAYRKRKRLARKQKKKTSESEGARE